MMQAIIKRLRRRWKYRKTWGTPLGRDCISLDISLCEWLAPRLRFLAAHHNSYPGLDYTSARWADELRAHAQALEAYAKHHDAASLEEENEVIATGQRTMRWVAEMMPTLWD